MEDIGTLKKFIDGSGLSDEIKKVEKESFEAEHIKAKE